MSERTPDGEQTLTREQVLSDLEDLCGHMKELGVNFIVSTLVEDSASGEHTPSTRINVYDAHHGMDLLHSVMDTWGEENHQ